MKRDDLLKFLANHFQRSTIGYPIFEVYLGPRQSKKISVSRTVMIGGDTTTEKIIRIFGHHHVIVDIGCVAEYKNGDELIESRLISRSSSGPEINWRGRLLKWSDLENINAGQFEEKVFSSYWRLLVTRRDADYFTRFEMSPSYYSPGHSTPGFPNYKKQIAEFVRYLKSLRDGFQVDPDCDRVVIFGRKEPEKKFSRCLPAFFGGSNFISYKDLEAQIRQNEDLVVDQIYDAVQSVLR